MIAVRTVVAITNPAPMSRHGRMNPEISRPRPDEERHREVARADRDYAGTHERARRHASEEEAGDGAGDDKGGESGATATIPIAVRIAGRAGRRAGSWRHRDCLGDGDDDADEDRDRDRPRARSAAAGSRLCRRRRSYPAATASTARPAKTSSHRAGLSRSPNQIAPVVTMRMPRPHIAVPTTYGRSFAAGRGRSGTRGRAIQSARPAATIAAANAGQVLPGMTWRRIGPAAPAAPYTP